MNTQGIGELFAVGHFCFIGKVSDSMIGFTVKVDHFDFANAVAQWTFHFREFGSVRVIEAPSPPTAFHACPYRSIWGYAAASNRILAFVEIAIGHSVQDFAQSGFAIAGRATLFHSKNVSEKD